jgi:bile acid:Na+ symporter, BASS family
MAQSNGQIILDAIVGLVVILIFFLEGLGLRWEQVVSLRRYGLVARLLLLNFVLIPAIVWVLTQSLPVNPAFAAGLLLVAICPGMPFTPKLAEAVGGDALYAVRALIFLAGLSAIITPVEAALLFPSSLQVNPANIFLTVVLLALIPLIVGLFVNARFGTRASILAPPLQWVTTVALALLLVGVLIGNLSAAASLYSSFSLAIIVVAIAASVALGYLLGGAEKSTRRVTVLTTVVRDIPLVLALAAQFPDPAVSVAVSGYTVLQIAAAILLAVAWRRGTGKRRHP